MGLSRPPARTLLSKSPKRVPGRFSGCFFHRVGEILALGSPEGPLPLFSSPSASGGGGISRGRKYLFHFGSCAKASLQNPLVAVLGAWSLWREALGWVGAEGSLKCPFGVQKLTGRRRG